MAKRAYVPTPTDTAWMKALVASLNVGGFWSYADAPIVFQKTGEREMTLVLASELLMEYAIKEQVERNRVVMAAAGIAFKDGRAGR